MKILIFVFMVMAFVSCKEPDGCEPEETRCEGSTVQICNTEKNWEESMNCDEASVAGLVFKCEKSPETKDYECVLKTALDTSFGTDFDTGSGWDLDSGDAAVDGGI